MPVILNRVERINPQKRIAPGKWYATVKTISQVKGLNIRFTPGNAIKEAIQKASFVFAENLVSK